MSAFDFQALSDQVRDQLLGDPFFSSIPSTSGAGVVLSDDPQDIITEINKSLNEIGLGLIVMRAMARVTNPNLPGPYFDDIRIVVKIYEDPTVNRAATNNGGNNPTASQAATQVCALLHDFTPAGGDECFFITESIPVVDPTYNVWQITAKTEAGLNYSQPPIAAVTASPAGPGSAEVTLACATPGAAIFYTLDGTYPSPRQGQLYLGPVAVAAGQLLKARAWLTGYANPNPAFINLQY